MLLSEVRYARPATLEQALGVLAENPGARALAGGQTLINVMKARAAAPDVLVDLSEISELKGIELGADGTLELGAMTTYSELIASAEARARPILGEVCAQIADVQVRNRGTIGGNVCSSDPTNHLPPLLVALGATITVAGARTASARLRREEFFLGVYMTAAGPGELLTKITVPAGRSDGFASVTIGVDGTCIVNAAASVNGGVRVALGCVAATPVAGRGSVGGSRGRPRRGARGGPRPAVATSTRRPTTGGTWPRSSPRARSSRRGRAADGDDPVVTSQVVSVEVNGTTYEREVEARRLLIHFLRDDLDLTGIARRLRHRQLRRLQRDPRRDAREELHAARRPGRRRDDRDGRGPGRGRAAHPAAAGVLAITTRCSAATARPGC